MRPKLSYRIWFSQRCGSTIFCETLATTGIAGRPGELLGIFNDESIQGASNQATYEARRQKIWDTGSTPNGVFGVKHAYHATYDEPLHQELSKLTGVAKEQIHSEAFWADTFPNCKHIFMTRRNKYRQAVSWWKAIKDEIWHLKAGESHRHSPEFYEEHYILNAFKTLLQGIMLKEAAAEAYFKHHNITPLTVVYEDFIRNPKSEIKRVVDYLEMPYTELKVGDFTLSKTSDELSEQWVQRLRKDVQGFSGGTVW